MLTQCLLNALSVRRRSPIAEIQRADQCHGWEQVGHRSRVAVDLRDEGSPREHERMAREEVRVESINGGAGLDGAVGDEWRRGCTCPPVRRVRWSLLCRDGDITYVGCLYAIVNIFMPGSGLRWRTVPDLCHLPTTPPHVGVHARLVEGAASRADWLGGVAAEMLGAACGAGNCHTAVLLPSLAEYSWTLGSVLIVVVVHVAASLGCPGRVYPERVQQGRQLMLFALCGTIFL